MKTRLISAIIAIAIAVPFVYYGGYEYAFAIGVLSILAFKELVDLKKAHNALPMIPVLIALTSILMLIYTNFDGNSVIYGATYIRLIFPVIALLLPTIFYDEKYTTRDAFYLIGAVLFLGIAFNSFIVVRDQGLKTFIYLVLIPICTDTFAFLIGCMIGKHKMAPKISPKKSWEGTIAGLIFGTLIPSLFYLFVIGTLNWKIVLGTLVLSCAGQMGDLLLSKVKRENDIKDFSNLMPGHGGALDRLDSTIVIFMTYMFLITILY